MTPTPTTLAWQPDPAEKQRPALDIAVQLDDDGELSIAQGPETRRADVVVWPKERAGELIAAIANAVGIRVQTWERFDV